MCTVYFNIYFSTFDEILFFGTYVPIFNEKNNVAVRIWQPGLV